VGSNRTKLAAAVVGVLAGVVAIALGVAQSYWLLVAVGGLLSALSCASAIATWRGRDPWWNK
jgi:hypothetical protein